MTDLEREINYVLETYTPDARVEEEFKNELSDSSLDKIEESFSDASDEDQETKMQIEK